jgi:site-specific recombinase XerD
MATSAERMRAYRERARRGLRRLAVAVGLFLTDSLSRMGIARLIERSGGVANLPFPIHVHMLRHSTGYAPAGRGMDTRRLQHYRIESDGSHAKLDDRHI